MGSHSCVSKVHNVIRHDLWGADGGGGASRELVTGNKYKSKERESGSDDEGTERSRAAPGCQIMTRWHRSSEAPFPSAQPLPTPFLAEGMDRRAGAVSYAQVSLGDTLVPLISASPSVTLLSLLAHSHE